ncbi:helix-turn-helix domain-containing protein [Vibrio jasicida]|uniref:helix-turn-helix domain-containing protein n=1 Tax=Vibrio jasicida TaxID=766224 RepID=UPI00039BA987|nr:helix-turn-helix transcriptional regulator [Vibrio jasicida]
MFGEILRSFRKQNGLSQLEFVNALQQSSKNFNNLDVVTLSRWERGATKPHLNRQNQILDMLGYNIFDIWLDQNNINNLPAYVKRLDNHGYFNELDVNNIEIVILNSTNLDLIKRYTNIFEIIFNFERNLILEKMEESGLMRESIVAKLIEQYGGEVTIALIDGQLIAHIFSLHYDVISDYLGRDIMSVNENSYFILSFNCVSSSVLPKILGREVYRYMHSFNPNTKLVVYVNNSLNFDLFFSLSFEYRSIPAEPFSFKLMNIESKVLKSQRVWMNILSQYKDYNDV